MKSPVLPKIRARPLSGVKHVSASDVIASRSVDLQKPSGERVPFRVEFGPVYEAGRDFRCQVKFYGWGDSPPDIAGRDSLQALILAVELVHAILAEFVRRGGRVLWPGTSTDCGLEEFVFLPNLHNAQPPSPMYCRRPRRRATRKPGTAGA